MTKNNLQALINSAESSIDRNSGQPVLCSPEWLTMIVEALEELKRYLWIPCSERLPEDTCECLVCFKDRHIETADYDGEFEIGFDAVDPIAWMPLPEPYKEGE